jgi:Flp pilus assembly protein TadD
VEVLGKAKPDSQTAGGATAADLHVLKQKEYLDKLNCAVNELDRCVALMPWDWRPRALRHEFLIRHGRADEAVGRMREALIIDSANVEYKRMLAQALELTNKKVEANNLLRQVASNDPDPWFATETLARNFEEMHACDSAIAIVTQFAESHPGDQRATKLLTRYQSLKTQAISPNTTSVVPVQAGRDAKKKG